MTNDGNRDSFNKKVKRFAWSWNRTWKLCSSSFQSFSGSVQININKIRDLFKVKLYIIRSETENKEKGATSIEKITKISASGRNFLDPSPPLFEKGPTDGNVGISYLIVIIKFGFFEIFNPPPLFH